MKRYAIVRVDRACPSRFECRNFEGLIDYYVCDNRKNNKKQPNCNKCLYGDTKEQLIRKIAQVLLRETTNYFEFKIEDKVMKDIIKGERKLARKIVEFLGVEKWK